MADNCEPSPGSWTISDVVRVIRSALAHLEKTQGQIAADRQEIENLKLDLHIANRALEIDLTTIDLRKRIVGLEDCYMIHQGMLPNGEPGVNSIEVILEQQGRIAELEKIVKDQPDPEDYDALLLVKHTLEAECKRLRDLLENIHDVAIGYDGYKGDAEGLEKLIDELRGIAEQSLRP